MYCVCQIKSKEYVGREGGWSPVEDHSGFAAQHTGAATVIAIAAILQSADEVPLEVPDKSVAARQYLLLRRQRVVLAVGVVPVLARKMLLARARGDRSCAKGRGSGILHSATDDRGITPRGYMVRQSHLWRGGLCVIL